jgi:putative phosphoribosyl transferase
MTSISKSDVLIPPLRLAGTLQVPSGAKGLVLFAHGSGSSRLSVRNNAVATRLNDGGFATLLLDLLTSAEEGDRLRVFDIALLSGRLTGAANWIDQQPELSKLPLGLFGASTGAAAALQTAAELGARIKAVVSRGGRPDLAGESLARVEAPTLLIVGGHDEAVLELNRQALAELTCLKAIRIIPGATHLFEEPGALEAVSNYAREWLSLHLHVEDAHRAEDGSAR